MGSYTLGADKKGYVIWQSQTKNRLLGVGINHEIHFSQLYSST